jgi:hypothetical protein
VKGRMMSVRFRLHGKVCTSGDVSRAGLKIKIIECSKVGVNTLLGQTFTDDRGHYSFSYLRADPKTKFNIFLEVSDRNRVLKKSDIISNVLPDEVKDFIIIAEKEQGACEIVKKVESLLKIKTPA